MELKTPVKKGFRTPHYRPPLPIISEHLPGITVDEFDWPLFNGHYNGTSVIVDDTEAISALTKKGFFGKGSLSRGCPNLGKRKFPYNVVYESQWERRKQWIKSLNDLLKNKDASIGGPSQEVNINNQHCSKVSSVVENVPDDIQKKSNSNEKEENCNKNSEKNSLGDKREESITISEVSYGNDIEKNLLVTADSGSHVKQLVASDKPTGQNTEISLPNTEKESMRDNCVNPHIENVKPKDKSSDNSRNTEIVTLSTESDIHDINCVNKMEFSSYSSDISIPNRNELLITPDTETSKTNKTHSECVDRVTQNAEARESLETETSDNSKNTETIDLTVETVISDSSECVNKMEKSYKSISSPKLKISLVVGDIRISKTDKAYSECINQLSQNADGRESLETDSSDNSKNTETIDLTGETVISNSSDCLNQINKSYNSYKSNQCSIVILGVRESAEPVENLEMEICDDSKITETVDLTAETVISDDNEHENNVDMSYNSYKSNQCSIIILGVKEMETSKTNKDHSECVALDIESAEPVENLEMEICDDSKITETVDLTVETVISDSSEHENNVENSSDKSTQDPNKIIVVSDIETLETNKDQSECVDQVTEIVKPTENLEMEICDDSKIRKTVISDSSEHENNVENSSDKSTQDPNKIMAVADIETLETNKDQSECVDQVPEIVKPTENLEMEICDDSKIRKTVDLNSERINLNANEVLVIADMEPDLEQYFNNLQPHIEEEKMKTVIEVLYLSLEEAFFLSFACNCLQVVDLSSNILGNRDMWVLFQNSQADFIEKYVAYHYFRAKGWVVKSGTKFGGDFLLYKKGPLFFHASYIVIIEVIKNGQNVESNMTWEKVNGISRMADSATKDVILCHVFWPTLEKEQFNDPSVLKEFGVRETLLRKWQATQEKTAPVE